MKALADAIVYAVVYIDQRDDRDEAYLDDDVDALESIAGCFQEATEEEKEALSAAAKRALEAERSLARPSEKFVAGYENWMEEMFGDEEWDGNERLSK